MEGYLVKTVRKNITLSEADYKVIKTFAKQNRIPFSKFLRICALKAIYESKDANSELLIEDLEGRN